MICITQNPITKVTIKAYKADALVTPQFDVWENLVKGIRIYFHWNNWIKLEKLVHPIPSLLALKQCSSGSSLVVQTFLVIVHHSDTFFGWQTLTIPNIHEIVCFFQFFMWLFEMIRKSTPIVENLWIKLTIKFELWTH